MKDQKFKIECGRCGETRSETLTEEEARTIRDGIGPVYRHCVRCERTTGWVEAAARSNAAEKVKRRTAGARPTSGSSNDRPVAHGQERLATASERDEVDAMLYEDDVVQNTNMSLCRFTSFVCFGRGTALVPMATPQSAPC